MKSTITIIALLFLFGTAAAQTTYYVPDDYPTIQDAINASSNGDTIIVRPGTYIESIDFVGKAVHLKSEKGPLVTSIISGFAGKGPPSNPSRGSVVYFQNGEGRDSILEGFTIAEGNGGYGGGGILCIGSSPSIRNNIITRNKADYGGGIYIKSGDVLISGTIVEANSTNAYGYGGGINCHNSTLTITDSIIAGNHADQNMGMGGGIYVNSSNVTLTNTNIFRNYAYDGAGIQSAYCPMTTLTNCVVFGNDATGGHGSGLYFSRGDASVANTIFWDNRPTNEGIRVGTGILSIHHSNVEGGQSSIPVGSGGTLNWGPGMIDADPLFVDSNKRDLHLTWDSPCKNTGDNSVVIESEDMEGDPRIAFGNVDMGADEFYYHLYYADVFPGSVVDVKVVGYPTAPVTLFLGSGIADPPYSTQHGDFWLNWPPLWQSAIGVIPSTGVLLMQANLPSGWAAGSQYPFQALVGRWGGAYTKLTNLMWLTVTY